MLPLQGCAGVTSNWSSFQKNGAVFQPGIPGRVWPPSAFERRFRGLDDPPVAVPAFYLELYDRVCVRRLAAVDGGVAECYG